MSEITNDKTIFSLLEVTRSIQKTLNERYQRSYWVKAEMNKLNYYRQSGHCYPDLVEKQEGRVIAQMRSCLWKDDYIRVDNKFRAVLREPLKEGIKILFLAKISFDPAHGLSLLILDIDPAYTLGDLEREKQETILKLREEGIFERNKSLKLPLLPQRIAIISVETSKGFADFTKIINTNPRGYRFFLFLFPSLLQGDKAAASISCQLKRIKKVKDHFDAVAIIRGGGGDVGLSCYNDYQLAREIAMFPIPVVTGIGHATNETVSEMVSFYNAITPTQLAEYLLQQFHNFSVPVQEAEKKLRDKCRQLVREEKAQLSSVVKFFHSVTENILIVNRSEVRDLSRSMYQHATYLFRRHNEWLTALRNAMTKDMGSQLTRTKLVISQLKDKLDASNKLFVKGKRMELDGIEKNVANMSPQNVLKRGYSITLVNGKLVKGINDVSQGDTVETIVANGKIASIVQSSKGDNE